MHVSRSCVERGLHGVEGFQLRPHPGNWALSFLLGGACILGAISRCHHPRAVYSHLPSRILRTVMLCDILHPHLNRQSSELALSVPPHSPSPSIPPLDCALFFSFSWSVSPQNPFQSPPPSFSFPPQLQPSGGSFLHSFPKPLSTNRRSAWSFIKICLEFLVTSAQPGF